MSFWGLFFWNNRGPGKPADQQPHDYRDNEKVDESTGIAEEDGQIVDNTSIDPEIQDEQKGFPK